MVISTRFYPATYIDVSGEAQTPGVHRPYYGGPRGLLAFCFNSNRALS